jgi:hypothetical protein
MLPSGEKRLQPQRARRRKERTSESNQASLDVRDRLGPTRIDHFSEKVSVKPGEQNQIVVPLLLWPSGIGRSTLEVEVTDGAGHRIGSSSVNLDSPTRLTTGSLIAIFCTNRGLCDEAQSQISFSGSEEDVSAKNQSLKFVALQGPRDSYVDYSAAKVVVIASALSGWTTEQRFAVEEYARAGGTVMLLENECADRGFLAAYRSGTGSGPIHIGRGKLYRIASLPTKQLGGWFAGKNWKEPSNPGYVTQASDMDPLRRWLRFRSVFRVCVDSWPGRRPISSLLVSETSHCCDAFAVWNGDG